VDGLLLGLMPARATPRKSAATWVEAMCLTAQLQLSPRPTQARPSAIMPLLSIGIKANQALVEAELSS
jgi:hypothetical protein